MSRILDLLVNTSGGSACVELDFCYCLVPDLYKPVISVLEKFNDVMEKSEFTLTVENKNNSTT